jgi:hypothetical protein
MEGFLFKISSGLNTEYQADLMDTLYIATISEFNGPYRSGDLNTSRNSLEFVVVCLSFDNRVFTSGCERTLRFPDIASKVSGCPSEEMVYDGSDRVIGERLCSPARVTM